MMMNDVVPPAPPKRNSDAWKWLAIGCGGTSCLGILVVVGFAIYVFNTPTFKKMMGTVIDVPVQAQTVVKDFETVYSAIEAYRKDHKGAYPKALKTLAPKYVAEARLTSPINKPYEYSLPEKGGAKEARLLRTEIPLSLPGAPPWVIEMDRTGQVTGLVYTLQNAGGNLKFDARTGTVGQ